MTAHAENASAAAQRHARGGRTPSFTRLTFGHDVRHRFGTLCSAQNTCCASSQSRDAWCICGTDHVGLLVAGAVAARSRFVDDNGRESLGVRSRVCRAIELGVTTLIDCVPISPGWRRARVKTPTACS
ncbi:MAG: hypothetical protein QOE30_4291 [Mycobacterium sp.]|jgi:hypothetical protein|nr:hypothetical protein [Mycobacterium sp.]